MGRGGGTGRERAVEQGLRDSPPTQNANSAQRVWFFLAAPPAFRDPQRKEKVSETSEAHLRGSLWKTAGFWDGAAGGAVLGSAQGEVCAPGSNPATVSRGAGEVAQFPGPSPGCSWWPKRGPGEAAHPLPLSKLHFSAKCGFHDVYALRGRSGRGCQGLEESLVLWVGGCH